MRMRNETHDPTTIINDQNGSPTSDKNYSKTRWKEYFNELLNNTQRSPQYHVPSWQYIHRRQSSDQGNPKQDTEGQQCQLPACPTTKTSRYPNGDKEQNHKLRLRTNTHIPVPKLDRDQATGAQNYNLRNEMLKESCQLDQKRHDFQQQKQKMVGTKSIHHHIQQQRIK